MWRAKLMVMAVWIQIKLKEQKSFLNMSLFTIMQNASEYMCQRNWGLRKRFIMI